MIRVRPAGIRVAFQGRTRSTRDVRNSRNSRNDRHRVASGPVEERTLKALNHAEDAEGAATGRARRTTTNGMKGHPGGAICAPRCPSMLLQLPLIFLRFLRPLRSPLDLRTESAPQPFEMTLPRATGPMIGGIRRTGFTRSSMPVDRERPT